MHVTQLSDVLNGKPTSLHYTGYALQPSSMRPIAKLFNVGCIPLRP